jgi:hypothetical protein
VSHMRKDYGGIAGLVFLAGLFLWSLVMLFGRADGAEVSYKTLNEAAIAALTAAQQKSYNYEFGGMIEKNAASGYVISAPRTSVAGDHVNIDMDPQDYKIETVASYHTHPCIVGYAPSKFSPPDMQNARLTGKPAFIADLCTGDVHRYNPTDKPEMPDVTFATDVPDEVKTAIINNLFGSAPVSGAIVGNTGIKSPSVDIGLSTPTGDLVAHMFHESPVHGAPDCGVNEVEFKSDQGVTCLATAYYFPPEMNWSQGNLSKSAPENDGTCPGRYVYKDDQGFTLFCWGKQ